MIYSLLKNLLFQLPPEQAHHLGINSIRMSMSTPILSQMLSSQLTFHDPKLEQNLFGLNFRNPVGLAAGFDKYCSFYQHYERLGFGFGEIGTITPLPQDGNDKPRLFRDPENFAILNRMGFNNGGMQKCQQSFSTKQKPDIPIAINIGKNKVTPNEDAKDDYVKLIEGLSPYADFFVVNISSPNTPGLRNLQAKDDLRKLIEPIMEKNSQLENKPIALKIAPDITEKELDDIVSVVLSCELAAIITTNTTIEKTNISSKFREEAGGVSGKPVKKASNKVLKWTAERIQNRIPIIGVGGVFSADDAWEKISLGASLVEVYTGWIYKGPGLVAEINRGLSQKLKTYGYNHISEAIGCALKGK